jgi:endonuclease/exonuclease/phosphatase family metal-dependent hydrolase
MATFDAGCHRYVAISTHLSWGSGREGKRLDEALLIDQAVARHCPLDLRRDEDLPLALLGGDLNCEPDSATLRWLRGLDVQQHSSTLWVDAWHAGSGPGWTSTAENPFSARTAQAVGITQPLLLPDRRIDFLLSRGYAYGRPGAAVHAELLGRGGDSAFGDHYGVGGTFLC